MQNFEHGDALYACGGISHCVIGGAGTLVVWGEVRWDERGHPDEHARFEGREPMMLVRV